ncbi:EMILIN-2 [Plecturocebus cupreus]
MYCLLLLGPINLNLRGLNSPTPETVSFCRPGWSAMTGMISAHCNLRISAEITGTCHYTLLIFVLLVEIGFCHVGQTGLELPTSGDPSTSASQSAGIAEMRFHHAGQAALELLISGDLPTLASQSAGITDNEPSQISEPRKTLSPNGTAQPSWRADPKAGPQELQEKKIQVLEEKVLRLTRTVLDLQSSLAGVSENLKHATQDDASKTQAPGLSSQHPQPDVTVSRDTQTAQHPGVFNTKEPGMTDIKSELAEVKDTLKNKSNKLEELDGKVKGYEGQLRQLQEAAQGPTVTMTANELYQAYVDSKIDALREELMEGMDRKLADLKNSCEYKLIGLQQQCDDYGSSYLGVIELIGEKETSLRKEINNLRARLQEPSAQANCSDGEKNGDVGQQIKTLDQKIERVAEAARMLNGRLDNEFDRLVVPEPDVDFDAKWNELDARINVTEKNAEEHCFYIEETLRGTINGEMSDLKQLVDQKIQALEDRLGSVLLQMANNTDGELGHPGVAAQPGVSGSGEEQVMMELHHLKYKVEVVEDICLQNLQRKPHGMEGPLPNREDHAGHDNLRLLKSLNDTMHRKFQETERTIQKLQQDFRFLSSQLNHTENNVTQLRKEMSKCRAGENAGPGGFTKTGEQERATETLPSPQLPTAHCCGPLEERWQRLLSRVLSELDTCKEGTRGVQTEVSTVEGRVSHVEKTCSKLDSISGSLQRIKEGLNKHVSSLWNCVRQMNGTLRSHSRDISGLKNSVQQFYSHVFQISSDLQELVKFQPSASKLNLTILFLVFLCSTRQLFCFSLDGVSLCHPGWSAVAPSRLTATSAPRGSGSSPTSAS